MREIIAVVRRDRANATASELARLGRTGYSRFPVLGRGQQSGLHGQRGSGLSFLPKMLFNIVTDTDDSIEVIESIIRANQTGHYGDGRIFVLAVGMAYRISERAQQVGNEDMGDQGMKMIKAIVRPEKETEVIQRLESEKLPAMTKWDVLGRGRQQGIQVGATVYGELSKLCLMMVVEDKHLERAVDAILDSAKTGHPGDGRVFVHDVQETYSVRTGIVGL